MLGLIVILMIEYLHYPGEYEVLQGLISNVLELKMVSKVQVDCVGDDRVKSDWSFERPIFALLLCYVVFSIFSIAWGNFFIDAAIILALIESVSKRSALTAWGNIKEEKVAALMLLYLGILSLSYFMNSRDFSGGAMIWNVFYYMMPSYFLGKIYIHSEKRKWTFLLVLAITASISACYSFWQAITTVSRVPGFIDLLELAGFLCVVSPAMLVVSLHKPSKWFVRVLGSAIFAMSMGSLILNGTRGAWVAVFIICALVFLYNILTQKNYRWVHLLALVLVGTVLTFVLSYSPMAKSRIENMLRIVVSMQYQETSLGARLAMWKSAWDMFCDSPLLGVGIGNYYSQYIENYANADVVIKYYGKIYDQWREQRHPHNSYLLLMAEAGIVGLLCYLSLLLFVLRQYLLRIFWQKEDVFWPLLGASILGVYLLMSLTENVIFGMKQYNQLLWLVIGVAWGKGGQRP